MGMAQVVSLSAGDSVSNIPAVCSSNESRDGLNPIGN